MSTQEPGLFDGPQAHARRTDPETSHAAARSITPKKLSDGQAMIMGVLHLNGPLTDKGIYGCLDSTLISSSGARTRRKELVRLGRVRESGEEAQLQSGRWATIWEAV